LHEGCTKSAIGSTNYCKAHGGGDRCLHEGCTKSAVGSTSNCCAHGGGKRCLHEGCTKSAIGSTNYCFAHGGGNRCLHEGCTKSARGSTSHCVTHGGGNSDVCTRAALSPHKAVPTTAALIGRASIRASVQRRQPYMGDEEKEGPSKQMCKRGRRGGCD
jgi:hypothetical protein